MGTEGGEVGGVGVEEMKQMAAKGVAERVQHQQQLPGWPGGLQLEALPSVLQLHFAFAYQVLVVEQRKRLTKMVKIQSQMWLRASQAQT